MPDTIDPATVQFNMIIDERIKAADALEATAKNVRGMEKLTDIYRMVRLTRVAIKQSQGIRKYALDRDDADRAIANIFSEIDNGTYIPKNTLDMRGVAMKAPSSSNIRSIMPAILAGMMAGQV